jgi:hypothetical protein
MLPSNTNHLVEQGVASVEIWNATQSVDVVPENILCKCHAFQCVRQVFGQYTLTCNKCNKWLP